MTSIKNAEFDALCNGKTFAIGTDRVFLFTSRCRLQSHNPASRIMDLN